MMIGELARASDASARMLRHYEAQGLITAQRSSSGYRTYDASTVERVQLIRQFLAAGLTVPEVAELLNSLTDLAVQRVALDERLNGERDRLDEQVRVLQRKRDALNAVIVSNAERQARITRTLRRPTKRLPSV